MQCRAEDEKFEALLAEQGFSWPFRKLIMSFTAEREFTLDDDGAFLFGSKMLTGSYNRLHAYEETIFSVMGYTIKTMITWEDGGDTVVSTMETTAEDGYFTSGWSKTTRITHTLDRERDEIVVNTIAAEGSYLMWLGRAASSSE